MLLAECLVHVHTLGGNEIILFLVCRIELGVDLTSLNNGKKLHSSNYNEGPYEVKLKLDDAHVTQESL